MFKRVLNVRFGNLPLLAGTNFSYFSSEQIFLKHEQSDMEV